LIVLSSPVPSPLSLHDALPIFPFGGVSGRMKLNTPSVTDAIAAIWNVDCVFSIPRSAIISPAMIHPIVPNTLIHGNCLPGSLIRSEEHTSELQSRENLVCRLLL